DIDKIEMLDYKIPGKTAGVNLYDGWEDFGVVGTNMHIQANAKGYKVRFEKVDSRWDLSYVREQVEGELPAIIPLP
ncbi:MAG: hypothetical protein KBS91_01995, partial [Firmicutes bacterium]|nr:hypothetical protein [Candidatus Caballimonas caccae]